MRRGLHGFVLFSVMLVIVIIALFSLMLLQTNTESLHLARMSRVMSVEKIKAKSVVQALVASGVGDATRCDSLGLSSSALLHASDAWWAMHACKLNDNALFVRDSPRVSLSDIIATPAGWVAAGYYYLTLRYSFANAEPVFMQALIAEPSSVKVLEPQGRVLVLAGMQQLACLSD